MLEDADKLNVLDVGFFSISSEQALAMIDETIRTNGKEPVSFINADCLNISSSDENYRDILNSQKLVLPDGAGISVACRLIGERLEENLNGTDLLPRLCELSVEQGYSIYLLGAGKTVAGRMKKNLEEQYPGLNICGEHHGYFDHDNPDEIIALINEAKPNMLLVAFGAPRQEKWIHKNLEKIDSNVIFGVGGLFDFFSGDKKRAPMWFRKLGLEWMYRLYLEPTRLWRRYIVGNPLFIIRLLKWKSSLRKQAG